MTYYKLYFDKYNHIEVMSMTNSDKSKYSKKIFLTDKKFKTKMEAINWYNMNTKLRDNNVKVEMITLTKETENIVEKIKNLLISIELLAIRIKKLESKEIS